MYVYLRSVTHQIAALAGSLGLEQCRGRPAELLILLIASSLGLANLGLCDSSLSSVGSDALLVGFTFGTYASIYILFLLICHLSDTCSV